MQEEEKREPFKLSDLKGIGAALLSIVLFAGCEFKQNAQSRYGKTYAWIQDSKVLNDWAPSAWVEFNSPVEEEEATATPSPSPSATPQVTFRLTPPLRQK